VTAAFPPAERPPLCREPSSAGEQCPVIRRACQALRLGRSFALALRRLRRSARQCRQCPERAQCAALQDLNQQIDLAILEIGEEWNLHLD